MTPEILRNLAKEYSGVAAQAFTDAAAEIERLNAEIERWRDSNKRLRDECDHQAKRVNQMDYDMGRLDAADALEFEIQQARDAAENQP